MVGLGNYIIYVTSAMLGLGSYVIYVPYAMVGLGNYVIYVTFAMVALGNYVIHVTAAMLGSGDYVIYVTSAMVGLGNYVIYVASAISYLFAPFPLYFQHFQISKCSFIFVFHVFKMEKHPFTRYFRHSRPENVILRCVFDICYIFPSFSLYFERFGGNSKKKDDYRQEVLTFVKSRSQIHQVPYLCAGEPRGRRARLPTMTRVLFRI